MARGKIGPQHGWEIIECVLRRGVCTEEKTERADRKQKKMEQRKKAIDREADTGEGGRTTK